MRRKDKEITNFSELEEILNKAKICHLAFIDDNAPYIVPVHYGYKKNHLYIHAATEGKKIDLLRKNPNICFEVELDHDIHNTGIPCHWSTSYKSIIGYGKATLLTNVDEKKNALGILIDHYSSGTAYEFSSKNIDSVAVIDIEIDQLTGKQSIE